MANDYGREIAIIRDLVKADHPSLDELDDYVAGRQRNVTQDPFC
jgi:hypothetical protein